MVGQKSLFIVDNDGLLWRGDVFSRAIYEIYKEFFGLRDLTYDKLERIFMSFYSFGGSKFLRRLNSLRPRCGEIDGVQEKQPKSRFLRYLKRFDCLLTGPLCKYLSFVEDVGNKMELYEGAERFLQQLKTRGKIVVWTNGLYDTTIKLSRKLIPNYNELVSETLYPEKLTYLGFTKPFKPNQNVVKWLIEKYKPEAIFSIGDHPYYDGFLTKSLDNGYSIIVYRKSKDMNDLIRDYWNSKEIRKHYYEIAKLYYSGKLILASSFDEAIDIIKKKVNEQSQ